MGNKRVMRRFRINEISAVDEPAQEPAKAVLMKRAGTASPMLEIVARHQNEIRKQRRERMAFDSMANAVAKHQESLREEKGASYERAPLPSINDAGPQDVGLSITELEQRLQAYVDGQRTGIETTDQALGRLAAARDPEVRRLYDAIEARKKLGDKHAGYARTETKS
jgi:hypothetical protein